MNQSRGSRRVVRIGLCALSAAWLVASGVSTPWAQVPGGTPGEVFTLDDLKRLALEQNPVLKSSRAGVSAAEAEAERRYADFFPKLRLEGHYSRMGDPPRLELPAGSFSAAPPFPPARTDLVMGDPTNYGVRFELEQPLFTGGALSFNHRDAVLAHRAAAQVHEQAVGDLLLEVEIGYWDILKSDQLLEVAVQRVAELAEHLRVVEAAHEAGALPYNDVLKTTVRLAEARQDLLTARNNADLSRMNMNRRLRRDLSARLEVAVPVEAETPELPPYARALDAALARRMDLEAARTRVESLEIRRRGARSAYFPSLSALARYDRSKETAAVIPENWEVLGLLRWTFWEWGKTGRDEERASFELRAGEEGLRALEDQIAAEVREQGLRAAEARERIAVAQSALAQAEENLRITEERFRAGVTTNSEVLEAESLLVDARANETNAVYYFQSARARLFRSMGVWSPPVLETSH